MRFALNSPMIMDIYRFVSFLLILLVHHNVQATLPLSARLEHACSAQQLNGASIGIAMYSLQNGAKIADFNSSSNLHPASIQKLFVTGKALDVLGGGFRYKTVVAVSGTITDGVLSGDVVVFGSGDPTFGSRFFESTRPEKLLSDIRLALVQKGIATVIGNIIVVNCPFTDRPVPATWLWQDVGNYYGAGSSGMTYMDNTYYIETKAPNQTGQLVEIAGTYPKLPNLHIDNYVQSSTNPGDNSYIFGGSFHDYREFRGTLPVGSEMKIKGSMPHPAFVFGTELHNYLEHYSINCTGKILVVDSYNKKADTITEILSPELREIVKVTNKKSHNLFAEQLMLRLAPKGNQYEEQCNMYHAMLSEDVPGLKDAMQYDACGLSVFNLVTADDVASFLLAMQKSLHYADFQSSLPVAGYDGTLKYWCLHNGLKGRVFAKTGSMTGVRSLAGYMLDPTGKLYAFCILINNYTCSDAEVKQAIESILTELYRK